MQFGATGAFDYQVGAAYSDNPSCDDPFDEPFVAAISPDFNGESVWGPVGIEFVIPNYFSPAHPNGDPTLLPANAIYFTARTSNLTATYTVASSEQLFGIHNLGGASITYIALSQLA